MLFRCPLLQCTNATDAHGGAIDCMAANATQGLVSLACQDGSTKLFSTKQFVKPPDLWWLSFLCVLIEITTFWSELHQVISHMQMSRRSLHHAVQRPCGCRCRGLVHSASRRRCFATVTLFDRVLHIVCHPDSEAQGRASGLCEVVPLQERLLQTEDI
jgi:hypothetical protein